MIIMVAGGRDQEPGVRDKGLENGMDNAFFLNPEPWPLIPVNFI
jgi:hypothetical protein